MKKIALVFILVVFIPSLALAWLAVRSLHDQQLILERQQSLLAQDQADALARAASDYLDEQQAKFARTAEHLMEGHSPVESAAGFDKEIRALWPPVEVGFVVTLGGKLFCPTAFAGPVERKFVADNGSFVCNQQGADVYAGNAYALKNGLNSGQVPNQGAGEGGSNDISKMKASQVARVVTPVQQSQSAGFDSQQAPSKFSASHAEFRDLVADGKDGRVARYVDNRLNLLIWHRAERDPDIIFGAQLSMSRMREFLAPLARQIEPTLRNEFAAAILDDDARPVSVSHDGFQANWRRPLAATEIGEALPHWEMALYLINPGALAQSARTLALTLGLLVAVLLVAISAGGWLIVTDLRRQLALARQKTDFVSNVSHELKTPLTSIRMFSELLAAGRVADPGKQRDYLNIITVEAARLTRLINNVLDFSRMDRGERSYRMEDCDLAAVVRETVETFRPHLEANQFLFRAVIPDRAVMVRGDRDALAQVLVNLLSNAEKYSPGARDVEVRLETRDGGKIRESRQDGGSESLLPRPVRHERGEGRGEGKSLGIQSVREHHILTGSSSPGPSPPSIPQEEREERPSRVSAPSSDSTAKSSAPALMVEVSILDRGKGVPRGFEEKIFEQFYRVDDSLSASIPGSGLGLTLARQIARAYGGDVVYCARAGGGSCFTFTLPGQQSES